MSEILVTGGAGYIGSHTVVELQNAGYKCVIIDNLCHSNSESILRQEHITGTKITNYKINLLDRDALEEVFRKHNFDAVFHFAGLTTWLESSSTPLSYYHNNVTGTIILLECMEKYNVNKLIFSSSATVYGEPRYLPIDEKHPLGKCSNPYESSKLFVEHILQDVVNARNSLSVISLRYFNPVGAHESGLIGESLHSLPNNILSCIIQVAVGLREELLVYGTDHKTKDGTGVREYLHVIDLALGHLAALKTMNSNTGFRAYNLGTGKVYSVFQVLKSMEKVIGREIPYKIVPQREGDVDELYVSPELAEKELNWKATRTIEDMCKDAWKFHLANPNGHKSQ